MPDWIFFYKVKKKQRTFFFYCFFYPDKILNWMLQIFTFRCSFITVPLCVWRISKASSFPKYSHMFWWLSRCLKKPHCVLSLYHAEASSSCSRSLCAESRVIRQKTAFPCRVSLKEPCGYSSSVLVCVCASICGFVRLPRSSSRGASLVAIAAQDVLWTPAWGVNSLTEMNANWAFYKNIITPQQPVI